MGKTFNLVSLGCPKNLVDSEVIYGTLENNGWTGVDEPEEASFLIINTCGFIQPAVEESIDEILQLASIKEKDPDKKLVVVGCLVQRYGAKLQKELPEIDLFVGTEGVTRVASLLELLRSGSVEDKVVLPPSFLMDASIPRSLSTPFFRAWMKITEGCDNRCSYCMIPMIRGRLRSRSSNDLVGEAQTLARTGVRELSLVAQDLTAYGDDLCASENLEQLLRRLLKETDIPWIRLMYLYPTGITDELLELMATESRIVPYLDIPLQHVNDRILSNMNRRYTRDKVISLFKKVRSHLPQVAIRTTFLLGFPGETEEDVDELVDFICSTRIDHVGVFAYANEEGCPAEHFTHQVGESEKEARVKRVVQAQAIVSAELLQQYVGRIETVLIEGVSEETDLLLTGRTRYQAPEIDGCVLINDGEASPGEILNVEITEAQVYDLVGKISKTEL